MFKLVKWAFDLGVKCERMRIKREISVIRLDNKKFQESFQFVDAPNKEIHNRHLAVSHEVDEILNKLTSPDYIKETFIYAPIDGDGEL